GAGGVADLNGCSRIRWSGVELTRKLLRIGAKFAQILEDRGTPEMRNAVSCYENRIHDEQRHRQLAGDQDASNPTERTNFPGPRVRPSLARAIRPARRCHQSRTPQGTSRPSASPAVSRSRLRIASDRPSRRPDARCSKAEELLLRRGFYGGI